MITGKSKIAVLLQLIVLVATFGCEKNVDVTLQVEVHTNQGDPVADASIRVGSEEVGRSDANGNFEGKLKLKSNSRHKIEITKSSDQYYFAPFFEGIETATVPLTVPIKATMFFVPKPDAQTAAETKPASTPTPEASEVASAPTMTPSPEATPEVATGSSDTVADESAASEPPPAKMVMEVKPFILTVHVYSGQTPLPEAQVFFGQSVSSELRPGCRTNQRGRCVIRFPSPPEESLTVVARKNGYLTRGENVPNADVDAVRLNLPRGETVDIFATSRIYNNLKGIPGIEVIIRGKSVGLTDAFGRLSWEFKGKRDELLPIALKSTEHLPEVFETDFVVSGPMSLVRYFSPREAPSLRAAVGRGDPLIRDAITKVFFGGVPFNEVTQTELNQFIEKNGTSAAELLRTGWQGTPLATKLDVIIEPVISNGKNLSIFVIDSQGQTIAGGTSNIANLSDAKTVSDAAVKIFDQVLNVMPFEGAVLAREGELVTFNIGKSAKRALTVGELVEIHGLQADARGRNQVQKRVAIARVKDVADKTAKAEIKYSEPRAMVSRGDLIILRPKQLPAVLVADAKSSVVKVTTSAASDELTAPMMSEGVSRAQVFVDGQWVGSTDVDGRYNFPGISKNGQSIAGIMRLTVSKSGFSDFSADIDFGRRREVEVVLTRLPAMNQLAKVQAILKGKAGEPELKSALRLLATVGPDHHDYLRSNHLAGEIYLLKLDDPVRAVEAFTRVTKEPAVADFRDKRFLTTHINEGVARFFVAERLRRENDPAAIQEYQKSVHVLAAVKSQLKGRGTTPYFQSAYYHAVGQHRIWEIQAEPTALMDLSASWREFLALADQKGVVLSGDQTKMKENARIYARQVQAAIKGNGAPKQKMQ